jgi:acetyl esterase
MRRSRLQQSSALWAVLFALSWASWCSGEELPAPPDERLKKILERFPDADTNHDGKLSPDEIQALRDKVQGRKDRKSGPSLKPDVADAKYGSSERNVLDLWKAKSEQPAPLVVFIHGGGFVGGSKGQIDERLLKDFLASGVSVAAVEYRFVTTDPFPAPMLDAARAVQFFRSKAAEWNIDPKRVACYGGSAGAGMSLWLAFHDDLAKPDSEDPVARQSTRLTCAGSLNGQSSYDPKQIREWAGLPDVKPHPSLLPFYGVKTEEELEQPAKRELAREASAITHLNAGDPPVLMSYSQRNEPITAATSPGTYIHHPIFGIKLKEAMDALKIECVLKMGGARGDSGDGLFEFLCKHLGVEPRKSTGQPAAAVQETQP